MLDNREKKNLLVVILAILCLIGIFVGVRSCDKSEENQMIEEDVVEKPEVDVEEPEDDKEVNVPVPGTNTNIDKVVVEYKDPVVTMKDQYSVNQNGTINLPTINVDDNGEKVTTEVSYEFMEIGNTQYLSVLSIDTSKIGTYKVTYKISNAHRTIYKTVYVEVVDNEKPVITANIKDFITTDTGTLEIDIPVLNNQHISDTIFINFSDNDKVEYAEYYKVPEIKTEIIDGKETIEQEAMPEVIEINPDEELMIDEDGEYHIRITDRSGNTSEFVVIHDETNPEAPEQVIEETDDGVNVSLKFNEAVQEIEGWKLSEDKKSLTKTYDKTTEEKIIVKDLAGNETTVDINVIRTMTVLLNDKVVRNEQSIESTLGDELKLIINTSKKGKLVVKQNGNIFLERTIVDFEEIKLDTGINSQYEIDFIDDACEKRKIIFFDNQELVLD